jgi:hypothetical protein
LSHERERGEGECSTRRKKRQFVGEISFGNVRDLIAFDWRGERVHHWMMN